MNSSDFASAVGLYKYKCERPNGNHFEQFYYAAISQLSACGIKPTYLGAEGGKYSGKLNKINSRMHLALVKNNFDDITVLSLVANPPHSNKPAYDSFASLTLSYTESLNEILACVIMNDELVKFKSPEFDAMLYRFIGLNEWDYGFGLTSPIANQPDFHILGLDSGKLAPEEYESLVRWHSASEDTRISFIRDLYPYNILNNSQINIKMPGGLALCEFIRQHNAGALLPIEHRNLHLWKIPCDQICHLKRTLNEANLLIS